MGETGEFQIVIDGVGANASDIAATLGSLMLCCQGRVGCHIIVMHNDGLETSSFDIPDDFAVDFVAGRVRESLNCDEQDLLIEAGVLVFGDVAAFLDPSVSCSRIETVEVGLVEQEVGEEDDESKPSFFAKVKSSESDDVRRRNIGPSGLDVESIPECPPGCIRLVGFDKAVSPSRYYDVPLGDFWLKAYLSTSLCVDSLERQSLSASGEDIQLEGAIFSSVPTISAARIEGAPLFSVVIPAYNAGPYISETIQSVLRQTLQSFEIICVDDGSTDNTTETISRCAALDDRVFLLEQENQYAGVARNCGIERAVGEYVTFLDADDFLAPNALESYYLAAKSCSADVVVAATYQFKQGESHAKKTDNWLREDFVPRASCFSAREYPQFAFNFTPGGPGGKCFRRDFIREANLSFLPLPKSEDFYFIHLGIAKASSIALVRNPVYFIRMLPTSLERRKSEMPLVFWEAILLFEARLKEEGLFERFKQSFINENVNRFANNLKECDEGASDLILRKLSEVGESALGLGVFPDRYFYMTENYEYLCARLEMPLEITSPVSRKLYDRAVDQYRRARSDYESELREIKRIRSSYSYRIGRAIMAGPIMLKRALRKIARCLKS